MGGIINKPNYKITVTELLDMALPFTEADFRCGMKRKTKTQTRFKMALLLQKMKAGYKVNLKEVPIMVDFATFEAKVNQWIGSLKTS